MEKRNNIIYWIATGLFSAMMLFSVSLYFGQTEMSIKMIGELGFPAWVVYFLGVSKLLGVVAILSGFSKTLKEWAYAGFTFNMILAIITHLNVGDGGFPTPIVILTLLMVSYFFGKKRTAK